MKKIAAVCTCAIIIGRVPVFGADSNNTTANSLNSSSTPIKQVQDGEQQLPQDVKDKINILTGQIKDLRAKIYWNRKQMADLLKQNKAIRKQIKENKTDNSALQQIDQIRKQIIIVRTQNKDLKEQKWMVLRIRYPI